MTHALSKDFKDIVGQDAETLVRRHTNDLRNLLLQVRYDFWKKSEIDLTGNYPVENDEMGKIWGSLCYGGKPENVSQNERKVVEDAVFVGVVVNKDSKLSYVYCSGPCEFKQIFDGGCLNRSSPYFTMRQSDVKGITYHFDNKEDLLARFRQDIYQSLTSQDKQKYDAAFGTQTPSPPRDYLIK